ncbi:subunit RPAC1 of DNA-directed RNA polymerases I and III [Hamiltosporidium magnivora]|uniref:Subunit RPAC1 of DNA-directed RNA polymerases I and III n=1 Tax=Hamiltosporidium magnivora TaxID=148818 RepID=A0A4Q9LI83_9MICR|nr:subunit RPAC1 of DNA-directed RNA polymerases I and III [Hamiltosporidium magnivora]
MYTNEGLIEEFENEKKTLNDVLNELEIEIIEKKDNIMIFDIKNVDCSIVNGIRRIIMSEIPTIAAEKIFMNQNTGVLPDETLAQRIGLIPLHFDPDLLDFVANDVEEKNTLIFTLKIKNNQKEIKTVYSDDLVWIPKGEQKSTFKNNEPFFLKRVPITKLSCGQELDLEIYCQKNIGKVHAKWSPVSLASYRLMPKILLLDDFYDQEALKLQNCFSKGVIGIEEVDGRLKAFVQNPRLESMSREVLRHKEFDNRIYLGRVFQHYIFTIESIYIDPLSLLKKALLIFYQKCQHLKGEIDKCLIN